MRHEDLGLQRLTVADLFPAGGASIHVNHPMHQGDIPLHDHDFIEIALVTGGHAIHRTIHGQQPVGPGDVLVLQPGQWHAYEQARELWLFNCCFGTDVLLRELAWIRTDPLLGRLFDDVTDRVRPTGAQGVRAYHLDDASLGQLVEHCQALRAVMAAGDLVRRRSDAIAHLLLLLGGIARSVAHDSVRATTSSPNGGPAARAIEAIEADLSREWSLDDLGHVSGLHRSHFVRRFRRATGLSPIAYIARRRAEKAAVLLLTTDLPIGEIGRHVGWEDPNYFARRFRAAFGVSARDYREQLPTPALARDGEDWIQW